MNLRLKTFSHGMSRAALRYVLHGPVFQPRFDERLLGRLPPLRSCYLLLGLTLGIQLSSTAQVQPPAIDWERELSGEGSAWGVCVLESSDLSYIVLGGTQELTGGQGKIILLNITQCGEIRWKHTLINPKPISARSLEQTEDGGFIIIGSVYQIPPIYNSDIFLLRTDAAGNELWTKSYHDVSNDPNVDDWGFFVHQTHPDMGYTFAVNSFAGLPDRTVTAAVGLFHTNSNGEEIWHNYYGTGSPTFTIGTSAHATIGGGYIVAGYTQIGSRSYLQSSDANGNWSGVGDTFWIKETVPVIPSSVRQTSDGNFIVAGSSVGVPSLAKIDKNGNLVWDKRYAQFGAVGAVQEIANSSGFVLVGRGANTNIPTRYVMRTGPEGDKKWEYTDSRYGDLYSIYQTIDGGFIFTGAGRSDSGYSTLYIGKLKPDSVSVQGFTPLRQCDCRWGGLDFANAYTANWADCDQDCPGDANHDGVICGHGDQGVDEDQVTRDADGDGQCELDGPDTFCRWACAISSIAMVLNYHAKRQGVTFATNPKEINDWLMARNNYTSNGLVKWEELDDDNSLATHSGIAFNWIQRKDVNRNNTKEVQAVLDASLEKGDPVILGVRGNTHFVVATAKVKVGNKDTYSIWDPLDLGDTLEAYKFAYSGIRIYSGARPTDQSSLTVVAHSPVTLFIIDPEGRRTGVDLAAGEVIEEIPESSYTVESLGADDESGQVLDAIKSVEVRYPSAGKYAVEVAGTNFGTYRLDFIVTDNRGRTTATRAFEATTSPSAVQTYEAGYKPDSEVSLEVTVVGDTQRRFRRGDSNGDGFVDLSDAIKTLMCQFIGVEYCPTCADAADANDDDGVDVSDAIYILSFLFLNEPAPPAPGPSTCGYDMTADELPACSYNQSGC